VLESHPETSRELAETLTSDSRLGQSASLLAARASVTVRDFVAARAAFAAAGIKRPEQLSDVPLLHSYARMQFALGLQSEAAVSYRLLMPRVDRLSSRRGQRLAAVVEAAFAVMGDSPEGAGEAIAFLTPHLEQGQFRGGEPTARLTLALALDRKGGATPKDADWTELPTEASAPTDVQPWLPERDLQALRGMALAGRDRDAAREAWRRYLDSSSASDPFREHAQSKLRALGGG
jgi:hypothetical protein